MRAYNILKFYILFFAFFACFIQKTFAIETIKIGVISELTGVSAPMGAAHVNGINMAVEEINRQGGVLGKPIELIIEDNQSSNPGTVSALTRILKHPDICAVITSIRSTQILAIMPLILKAKIPALVGGTDYSLTHLNNPWIFRIRPHDGYSAKVVVDYGAKELQLKRWVIVHSTELFGISGKNRLLEFLTQYNISPVLVQPVNNTTQDYQPIAETIKQVDHDALIFYMANSEGVGLLAKKLKELKVNSTWLGAPTLGSNAALNTGGNALHNSYVINDFFIDANPTVRQFVKNYRERHASEPDLYAGWGYDAIHLLNLAMRSTQSVKPNQIRLGLNNIKNYQGVEGNFVFDKNGDGIHGYNILKNQQGKLVFIKHISFTTKE